jgi:hypothetical protein
MPVLLEDAQIDDLPEYLRATTVLRPCGECAAEIAYCANDILRRRHGHESSTRTASKTRRGLSALKLYHGVLIEAWADRPVTTVFELLVNGVIIARSKRPAIASIFSGVQTIFGRKPVWTIRSHTIIHGCTMMLRADFVTEFSDQRIELFLDDTPLDALGSYAPDAQQRTRADGPHDRLILG